jgi:hypothetical protein
MLGASIKGQFSVVYKIKKKKNTRRKKIMSAFNISGEPANNAFNQHIEVVQKYQDKQGIILKSL